MIFSVLKNSSSSKTIIVVFYHGNFFIRIIYSQKVLSKLYFFALENSKDVFCCAGNTVLLSETKKPQQKDGPAI